MFLCVGVYCGIGFYDYVILESDENNFELVGLEFFKGVSIIVYFKECNKIYCCFL